MKNFCVIVLLSLLTALPALAEAIKISVQMIELPADEVLRANPAELLKLKAISLRTLPTASATSGEEVTIKDVKLIETRSGKPIEAGVIFRLLPTSTRGNVSFRLSTELITFEGYTSSGAIRTPEPPAKPSTENLDAIFSTQRSTELAATTPYGAALVTFVKRGVATQTYEGHPTPDAIDALLNPKGRQATRLYAIITFTKG